MKRIVNGSIVGLLLWAFALAIPSRNWAQPISHPIEHGDRVRIITRNTPAVRIDGTVALVTLEQLVVQGAESENWELQWLEISQLQIQKEKRNTNAGGLAGLAVGAFLGGIWGISGNEECNGGEEACWFSLSRGDAWGIGAALGGLSGLLLGTLVGASSKTVAWQLVEIGISEEPLISAKSVRPKSLNPIIRIKIPLGK